MLADQIRKQLDEFLAGDPLLEEATQRAARRMFRGCSEILLDGDAAYVLLRPGIGQKRIIRVHPAVDAWEEVERGQYLEIKDAFVQGHPEAAKRGLVIDFALFS